MANTEIIDLLIAMVTEMVVYLLPVIALFSGLTFIFSFLFSILFGVPRNTFKG